MEYIEKPTENKVTLKDLSQLYYLSKEIKRDQDRLLQMRARISVPGIPNYNGMPKNPLSENHIERYIAEIIDIENIIDLKTQQSLIECKKLVRYISDIPDSLTRQIFTARFVECKNWTQVAIDIGGGNTEEGVRKRVYRYLKHQK